MWGGVTCVVCAVGCVCVREWYMCMVWGGIVCVGVCVTCVVCAVGCGGAVCV